MWVWCVRGVLACVARAGRLGAFGVLWYMWVCWHVRGALARARCVGALVRMGALARAGRLGVCGACWHVQGALVRACASAGVRAGGGGRGREVGCGDLQGRMVLKYTLKFRHVGRG